MSHPVFISYARDASRAHASALHQALGGCTAFLDTEAIQPGERFPQALVDALFDARVVVIFAEPRYFTRWYCLLEFRIARTPFLRVAERPGATAREKEDALRGLVVAMPPRGADPMLERFPPLVQGRSWPAVDDIDALAALVEAELAANPSTLRERFASVADADEMRAFLLAATHLPPPMRIGAVPFVPQTGLPRSIAAEFVGRADDLWRIHDLLWTERGDPATAAGLTGAIEATGGFGKTRLALEYLYRFGPRHFKGGLFWINAESDAELQLYDVLQALNPRAPAIEIVRQGSGGVPGALARAIRARPDDAPAPLFVIDNVPEPQPDQPPKPLDTWCPVLGEVPVLTTSRTRVLGGGVVALPIETLTPAAAVDLLTIDTSRDALDDAEWKHIAEWVGHLPLALEVLNRLLRSGAMDARALLSLSREERPSAAVDKAMETLRPVVEPGALRGVTEAFSASYNLLTPEEQYAARLIAWMAPAPIPTFVLDAFGPEVFAPGVRARLRTRSFVTEVRDGSGAYFGTMHRVLADFLRAQSNARQEEAGYVASVLEPLMESAQGQGDVGSSLVRECGPLAHSLFANWAAERLEEEVFLRASGFASRIGGMLRDWGYLALAEDLFASAAAASSLILGDRHRGTLSALNDVAVTRRARGDYDGAQTLTEQVLAPTREVFGEDHPYTLFTMANLANVQRLKGDYTEARALLEHVTQVMQRVLGEEHSGYLAAMHNLAAARFDCGDHAGAQEVQEQVLHVMRRIHGEEHPHTLSAMNNLAATRASRGDNAGAEELHEHVLAVRLRTLGEEHPDTISALNDIALVQSARGNHARALALQERALQASSRILGEEHPSTIRTMANLAIVRGNLGDHAGAHELQERVLAACRRIPGSGLSETLSAINTLAYTRAARGDSAGALDLLERVLPMAEGAMNDEHPEALYMLNTLAAILLVRGDSKAARRLQEPVLESMRATLGVEHPKTTVAAWGLLQSCIEMNDAAAVTRLVNENLLWLLDREGGYLTRQQREIQTALRSMMKVARPGSAGRRAR